MAVRIRVREHNRKAILFIKNALMYFMFWGPKGEWHLCELRPVSGAKLILAVDKFTAGGGVKGGGGSAGGGGSTGGDGNGLVPMGPGFLRSVPGFGGLPGMAGSPVMGGVPGMGLPGIGGVPGMGLPGIGGHGLLGIGGHGLPGMGLPGIGGVPGMGLPGFGGLPGIGGHGLPGMGVGSPVQRLPMDIASGRLGYSVSGVDGATCMRVPVNDSAPKAAFNNMKTGPFPPGPITPQASTPQARTPQALTTGPLYSPRPPGCPPPTSLLSPCHPPQSPPPTSPMMQLHSPRPPMSPPPPSVVEKYKTRVRVTPAVPACGPEARCELELAKTKSP